MKTMKMKKFGSCALAVSLLFAAGAMGLSSFSDAEATELSPEFSITVDTPELNDDEKTDVAVIMKYIGDTGDLNTYMHLGYDINPNYGYKTVSGSSYTVVGIPNKNSKSLKSPYCWIQAFININDEVYSSQVTLLTSMLYYSKYTVTDSVVSGTLTTSDRTLTYSSSDYSKIYFIAVYHGGYLSAFCDVPSEENEPVFTNLIVNGVTFTVKVYHDKIAVHTSEVISCNQYSGEDTSYGAFAYYAE